MRKENTIDYLELPSTDIPKTKACSFKHGRNDGGFCRADKVAGAGADAPLLVLYRADLEAAARAVSEAGGEVVKPIFSFPGGRRFHFTDPNGNELAVWSEK